MAGEWEQTRLGDCIALKGGLSYKGEFVDKGDALLIGMGCVSHMQRFLSQGCRRYGGDFTEAHLVEPGDLVIATRQQSDNLPILGFPAMIPNGLKGRNVVVATNLYKVVNHSSISNRFLYWLLRGREYRERILKCSKGTTVRMLTKDAIEDFLFFCPPVTERDVIAGVLDSLDDKIELNRRMNETLEAMARALFKSWFVDFDPVRAKAEGRWRRGESLPGLPANLFDLFPDSFEDSELGEIPKGWEVNSLDEIARFLNGLALQKYPPNGDRSLPVIKIAQLRSGRTDDTDHACADLDPDYVVIDGDILFSWSGSLECVVWAGGPGALNQHLFKVTSTNYPRWLCYFAIHHHLEDFRHIASGKATTMGHIQRHHLSDAKVVAPAQPMPPAIDEVLSQLFECHWKRDVECRTLAALRDTLLPRLISGELRIPEAAHILERAT